MANKYRWNSRINAFEKVESKEDVVKRLLEKGKSFDEKLLAWYGENQQVLAR